ncbi:hypothetical protein K505DRAFT_287296 [Melanomma pulvis-pyrius CBS 109.77]|uniref:Uncharacterized protein n=1 Tax=Melanomma pulvis-pyrius CBS 109.77 TaxID=1314802 RepID=A0A6A6WV57_9PLEO|nr:hypothetical protein K505DRAFT_287296 [Melanomma pulvis-pyrius CBS 109.77]
MFGHPGISALEFAGTYQQEVAKSRKALSLKGKTTTSTHDNISSTAASADTAELESPQPVLQEATCQQRRRGTFINHTPRTFEMRSPKRMDFQETRDEITDPSDQGTCDEIARHSSNQKHQTTSVGHWTAKQSVEVNAHAPVELDSKEVVPPLVETAPPRARTSFASKVTGRSPQSTSTAHSSQEVYLDNSIEPHRSGEKRRRRQTPYKITAPNSAKVLRHSSLEPLVAHHRRQGTSSTVSDQPPQVEIEIDDIAGSSTFRAIQEYFDNQESTGSSKSTNDHCSSSPPDIPLPSSPELPLPISPFEPAAVFPADELDVPFDQTPELPVRSPARLHTPVRTTTPLDGDFVSAAEGQYSPYSKNHDNISIPKRRGIRESIRAGQAARAGSSILGRMAPPILGHAALTATADLNDLSFYLKNTGPSTDSLINNSTKKPVFKKMFKARGKKSLAARVGSVEGSPSKNRPKPPMLACAREMRTSSGARHLRIVVPTNTLSHDHTITLPIFGSGPKRRSRHISITWTDEMLNPLASPELEHAISDFNAMEMSPPVPPVTPIRSLKRSPFTLTPVPVEDHPLKTREEQTKARKIRDLKKIKRQISTTSTTNGEDTTAGALATPVLSPIQMRRSPIENDHEDDEEEVRLSKMVRLQYKVVLLQRQNTELAEALAKMMGLGMEDEDIETDVVLRTYRQLRFSSDVEE